MKKALLVGINAYPSAPLNGCINDCKTMQAVLDKFGFTSTLLTDSVATKKNIIDHLRLLVAGAKAGDALVFHFSGHGSQVPTTDSSEPDGMDEIICPYDLNWSDPLLDTDLNKILRVVPPGVRLLVILDCCHSGTGVRYATTMFTSGIRDIQPRYLPPPTMFVRSSLFDSIGSFFSMIWHFITRTKPEEDDDLGTPVHKFSVDTDAQGEAILISGCMSNQVSADAFMEGKYQGALTYAIARVLSETSNVVTYVDLVNRVNTLLRRLGFAQTPQLECRAEYKTRLFLG